MRVATPPSAPAPPPSCAQSPAPSAQSPRKYLASMPPNSRECARACTTLATFLEDYAALCEREQALADAELSASGISKGGEGEAIAASANLKDGVAFAAACVCVFGMGIALGRRGW
uniref:Uncharacterized protein n=1 Tax=Zooxanthella nutricula TaxID=1333877 RepID=A0A7S2KLW8_9DINO